MDLRSKLYHKVQVLSLSFLNSRKPGEIMNRVVGDTNQIRRFMEDSFSNMLSVVVTMIGALGLMIYMSPMLTLLSTMFMGVVIALSKNICIEHGTTNGEKMILYKVLYKI